jgi:hypothetical protein
MAATKRIYKVTTGQAQPVPEGVRLVRADNKVQAVNHVARMTIKAELASQDDLVKLAGTIKVEDAGVEPAGSLADG